MQGRHYGLWRGYPLSGLGTATLEADRTPGLSDPSGSDLRVVSHDGSVLLVRYL